MSNLISVHQIFFDSITKAKIEDGFLPYENLKKDGYFENTVIKEVYEAEQLKNPNERSEYIGVTSWKQRDMTNFTAKQILQHIEGEVKAGQAKDVYLYPPLEIVKTYYDWSHPESPLCGTIHGHTAVMNHQLTAPAAFEIDVLLNNSKILPFNLFDKWVYSFRNYWIVRKEVYDDYCKNVLLPVLAWLERPDIKERTSKATFVHQYDGQTYPPYAHVLEGLFGAFMANRNYSYSYIYQQRKGKIRKHYKKVNILKYDSGKNIIEVNSKSSLIKQPIPSDLPVPGVPQPQQELQNRSDMLIIYDCNELLYFHNVELLQDVLKTANRKVITFNLNTDKNLALALSQTANIICYRTSVIPNEVLRYKGRIKIGYLIDDNLFYVGEENLIDENYRKQIRLCIKTADYCITFSKQLTIELAKLNPNSYCMGNPPLWRDRYSKHGIPEPFNPATNMLTVGMISRNHFNKNNFEILNHVAQELGIKIKVLYFSNHATNIRMSNIEFEYHAYTGESMKEWYSALHSLPIDMIYIEYPNNILIAGKSDLKFREGAYMKIPLIALDPTEKIYSDIVNGENGYAVSNREKMIEVLKDVFINREKLKLMGEKAHQTLIERSPSKFAFDFIKTLEKVNGVEEVDFLFLYSGDALLYFHNVAIFKSLVELSGKNVKAFSVAEKEKFNTLVPVAKNIVLYRTNFIPDDIRKRNKKVKVGYLIDDNIFYEGSDNILPEVVRQQFRTCIEQSDYCLSFSANLTKELLKINQNSYFIGNRPLWKGFYESYEVEMPHYKNDDDYSEVNIGVISGRAHATRIADHLRTLIEVAKQTERKVKIIYFYDRPIELSLPNNVTLKHHPFTELNIQKWYHILHSLHLDFVYAEYPDHIIISGKSDLKFRETAFMKVPLVVLDPSEDIYPDIINGKNGYSLPTRKETFNTLKKILDNPEMIKNMGEEAYKTLQERNPQTASKLIIDTIDKIHFKSKPPIQVFKPKIREEAIISVGETLKSGWLGTGPKTKQFEIEFKKYLNAENECVAVMSATDGLELAVKLCDIGEGDEVITTAITFISTNHAILYAGATPVFADVDKSTGSILPSSIEEKITERTKAIMVVHLSGYACDMENIESIAQKYNIKIIEDCAHATGGIYHNGKNKGKKIGSGNNISVFSFQTVKNLPCGDGGMLLVPQTMMARAVRLRWMGIDKDTYSRTSTTGEYLWKYDIPEIGIKANQNDIMSSIGLVQLKYIDQDNLRRKQIANFYKANLGSHPKISLPAIDIQTSACHFYPLYVKDRDSLLLHLRTRNIFVGVHYRRNDKYKNYEQQDLPNSEYIETHTITLPIHLHLTDEDLQQIVTEVNNWK